MNASSIELEARLIEQVVEKRNTLLADSEKKAKQILKSGEEEVRRIKDETEMQVLNVIGSELKATRDRILGRAELEGRRALMDARQDLISVVFDRVEKKLMDIAEGKVSDVDYGEVLEKFVVEAALAMGGEEFIVSANERDLAYIKKNIRKINKRVTDALGSGTVKLDEDLLDAMGGVMVRNPDGTKTYYSTLEGKLKGVRSGIEAEVGHILGVT